MIVLTPDQINILVDDSGHARLADFGLSMVSKNLASIPSARLQHGSTPRWTAPELVEGGICEKEADIFSFAMVMFEVRRSWCPLECLAILTLHVNTDLYGLNSIRGENGLCGHVGYNARGTTRTAKASQLHRKAVVVDATVLGS